MNQANVVEVPTPLRNHLLAALTVKARTQLLPHLERVHLPRNMVLYSAGEPIQYVYFPVDSIVSLSYEMEDGASANVSLVGNDGVVGIAIVMGCDRATSQAIVHSAGFAFRLSAQRLKEMVSQSGEILRLLLRYTQALMTQVAQTVACNRLHSVDQQLCRWLLLALDRVSMNRLNMTHELIASMLGVRRESITDSASTLQKLGVIEYHRGHITVLDRPALEYQACECYAAVKQEADRLQPYLWNGSIDINGPKDSPSTPERVQAVSRGGYARPRVQSTLPRKVLAA